MELNSMTAIAWYWSLYFFINFFYNFYVIKLLILNNTYFFLESIFSFINNITLGLPLPTKMKKQLLDLFTFLSEKTKQDKQT